MKILILGVSGMLGHKLFEIISKESEFDVYGTVIKESTTFDKFPKNLRSKIIFGVIADKPETFIKVINDIKPKIVINAIGIIKQNNSSKDTETMIKVNALFPHQLANACTEVGARMITIATDCVFDGQKGEAYLESDIPTCHDTYGMTKYLGEIYGDKHLTLRTSIIGHELETHLSLLDWFINEPSKTINGYTKAIFSGLTTLELSKFLLDKIFKDPSITGLWHLSVNPISKFDLLSIIAKEYNKEVEMIPSEKVIINRALNSDRLREKTGYIVKSWEQLIKEMHEDYLSSSFYK